MGRKGPVPHWEKANPPGCASLWLASLGMTAFERILGLWTGPAGFDDGRDPSARTEITFYNGPDGVASLYEIFKNLVDDVFLKDAQVAIAEEVLFVRLELDATFAWHVAEGEDAEVGQAGFGADRGKLRIVDENLVAGELVRPCFDGRECEIEPSFGVLVGVSRLKCHTPILVEGEN